MNDKTTALVSAFLSAKDADTERVTALKLVEHLRETKTPFDVTFKEINRPEDLSNEAYLENPRGIVVITIEDRVYVWEPLDRVNTDMFFTE